MKYFFSKAHPMELVLTENLDVEFPTHNHANHWVLSMVLCGGVVLKVAGAARELGAGGHFVLPPYTPHSLALGGGARLLSLCVRKEWLSRCGNAELESAVREFAEKTREACGVSSEQARRLAALAAKMTELAKRGECTERGESSRASRPKDLEKLAKAMETAPEGEYALESVARALRVDKFSLVKRFKRHFGLPPHKFLLQNRVRKAQRLLRRAKTVAEVSAATGFYDQSHFDKAFGKIVGISPREYKDSPAVFV